MELFREDGHLTDAGLRAVVDGTLDEMSRLEAAEHLGFCDECLVRYTALLTDEVLIAPETPVKEGVSARIRKRSRRILWSKYGTVAAALALAVVMFSIGSFAAPRLKGRAADDQNRVAQSQRADAEAEQQTRQPGIVDYLDGALNTATRSINGFFNGLVPSGNAGQNAEEEQKKQDRDKHAQLFESKNKTGHTADPDNAGKDQ